MSSGARLEFFLDRSLGKSTAARLRDAGHSVHLIADHYPSDASNVPDEDWIAEGCSRGWVLLTKDKRIRYRAHELTPLHGGHLFCLAGGNMTIAEMSQVLLLAMPKVIRAVETTDTGFWHVYRDGSIKRMWP
jgi:PIN like domain